MKRITALYIAVITLAVVMVCTSLLLMAAAVSLIISGEDDAARILLIISGAAGGSYFVIGIWIVVGGCIIGQLEEKEPNQRVPCLEVDLC